MFSIFFMTNYIEYKFKVAVVEPFNEIIIAMISELPFESFVENEEGFDAYMPKTEENIDDVKEVREIPKDFLAEKTSPPQKETKIYKYCKWV